MNQTNQANDKTKEAEKNNFGQDLQMVTFGIAGENYAFDILKVKEIIMMTSITRMPKCPDFIEGVVNLRGQVIPIIDLRKRFLLSTKEYDDNTRIIIVDISGETIGLIVDEVYQVMSIPESSISPPSAIIAGISSEYLQGIGRMGDKMLIILDLEKILTHEEKTEVADIS